MNADIDNADPLDVAIVGAGPIGLLLAGELAAHGVRVVVFERADAPWTLPKANGVVGHSALALAKRGVLRGTRLRVLRPPRFQFGPLTLRLGFGPGNPLHILPVPQARLEEILEHRAIRAGAQVRRGHEVTGFTHDDAAVHVEVRSGAGMTKISSLYVVGCDGAHSFVRTHAGIAFPGFTSDEISRIARVTIPADQITRRGDGFDIAGVGRVATMRPNQLPGGGFSIAPVSLLDRSAPRDLYLVSTHEPRGGDEPSDSVSVDELRGSLRRVLGAVCP
jgi:2-polyprenyl-6-methoxyphenol hydroxylase-like FAD-dependent oxidoreductase